jgi:hypothetical protein
MAPNATRDAYCSAFGPDLLLPVKNVCSTLDGLSNFCERVDMSGAIIQNDCAERLALGLHNSSASAAARIEPEEISEDAGDQRLDQAPAGSSEDDWVLENRPKRIAIFVEPSPWS